MRNWIARWIVNIIALAIVTRLNVGVSSDGLVPLVLATVTIGFANTFIRPILAFLTMPLTCLTFGLFSYVISFVLFFLVGQVVPGFDVTPIGAVVGSLLMSVVAGALTHFLCDRRK
ncbi:MAG: phage holin family protein [Chthonomonadales bacterium]|nr:phage holin family protein [Chthonomonadales bacterium]